MSMILAELFKHNAWANDRMLEACAPLSDDQLDATVDGTFGTIRETLAHIVRAERGYLGRFTGESLEHLKLADDEVRDFAVLRQSGRASGEGLVSVAQRMPRDEVMEGIWRGDAYAIPASVFLTQAINHATEHRVQIATILTQLGITPPDLDGWSYGEAMAAS